MSQYEHIHSDFRHIMRLSDAERMSFLYEPRWIEYRRTVLDTLQGLLQMPKRPKMPNLLIVGDANNGKTTILERFQNQCGQGYINEDVEAVKPVIFVEPPPKATEKDFYVAILERFFTPYRVSDPAVKLRYQVVHLCRTCHVRMIVIDEFHSLMNGTPRQRQDMMNTIKFFCNELRIPIVGVGTRVAVQALHKDPQHAKRFDVMSLPLWPLEPEFQELLAGFELILPLKHPSELSEPTLATAMYNVSGGNLGDLHGFLIDCAKEAIKTGAERIDLRIVDKLKKTWKRSEAGYRDLL